jgi:RNA polymerase sigma factor (sigma-70 family)
VYSDYARKFIRFKARQLAIRGVFSRSDEADLAQELTAHLLRQAKKFDPSQASVRTFVNRVVVTGARMILRQQYRRTRLLSGSQIQSLSTVTIDFDGCPTALEACISVRDVDRRTGARSKSDLELLEQSEFVCHAVTSLPPDLQVVCRLLTLDGPVVVAKRVGLSRYRMRRAVELIRQHFRRMELREIV